MLFWIDALMIPIFIVWTLANGELMLLFPAMFSSEAVFWSMTGTAALGGVRALSQYAVLMFVSAASMSTSNVFAQVLNILVSLTYTQSGETTLTAGTIAGVALVIVFSGVYAVLKSY